ncbi:MAG: hypothetical protein ABSC23_20160 [Bryobacteraceae bacterium]
MIRWNRRLAALALLLSLPLPAEIRSLTILHTIAGRYRKEGASLVDVEAHRH